MSSQPSSSVAPATQSKPRATTKGRKWRVLVVVLVIISGLLTSAYAALSLYVAPLLIGGRDARPLIAGLGAGSLGEARRALRMEWQTELGGDLSVNAVLQEW